MYTRSSVARLPGSSFTHGAVRTGGFAARVSEVPEYARQSNEAGGPKYVPPYTPKAPAYVPMSPGLVPGAYVPSTAKPPGAPAKPGALPGGGGRRKVPARYVYNRGKRVVSHAYDDLSYAARFAGGAVKRARAAARDPLLEFVRDQREHARARGKQFIDEQKEHARQRVKKFIVDQRKHAGGRVKKFIGDQAKHAAARAAKAAAWGYAKLRVGAAVAKRGSKATWNARSGAVKRRVRQFSRTHVVNPVYQASRAVSAARGWVRRHR